MKDVIRKITDVMTIVFPSIVGILGVFNLTGGILITEKVEQIVFIVLGALSAVASVIYNQVTKKEK